jgi:galactokinase
MMEAMSGGPGVVGARQAGAVVGGCMVALVERDCLAAFAASVETGYETATGIRPGVFSVT